MAAAPDRWSRWLLERRDAGNERQREVALSRLNKIRDRVLRNAEPLDGATLLDVGTGDGLIGVEALDRVGADGSVIFTDISEALLERSRRVVKSRGGLDRARFLVARAEDLAGIADACVDVLTTRSVLIYVTDKARAFSTLYRVLRPGGRISLFEPINQLIFPEPSGRFWGYDVSAFADLATKVKTTFRALEDPAFQGAMMDFDDRDLARLAEEAGFERVHVECHLDIKPGGLDNIVSLDALLDGAPNPNAPTIREAIQAALTEPEQIRFLAELERAFAEDRAVRRSAFAYVVASKSL
ncbi:MAG: class I SAM-dependent methyltransferase [Solirubrobacteraceae bacterium]